MQQQKTACAAMQHCVENENKNTESDNERTWLICWHEPLCLCPNDIVEKSDEGSFM